MNLRLVIVFSMLLVLLAGCVRTYRIDIQQGNVLTTEQIQQLKPGMEKAEVRYLLGAPLVEDPFHTDRWDYFYSFFSGKNQQTEQRHLTLFFEDERLLKVEQNVKTKPRSLTQTVRTKMKDDKSSKPGFLKRAWRKIWSRKQDQSN